MTRLKFWALIILIQIVWSANTKQVSAQGNYDSRYDEQYNDYGASYQDFYDGLAPYGQWISDPMYGYVWLPNVGPDFRPYYTNGYWVMTEYGNTWISNYDWGWAPFHYGRWTFDNYYGWLWIPDTQWAPAWVSWRSNNNYYGWAPMGPGVGINVSLGSIPVDWWVFLSPNYFYEPRFHRYCNNDWRFNRGIYSQTTYINYTYNDRRTVYYTGPRADDYRRRTGRQSSMYNINNNNRRGATVVRGNNVNIYRPRMRNIENNAPRKIVQTERRVSERPQTFVGNKVQPEGRQKVLRQSPVENNRVNNQSNRLNNTQTQPAIRNERQNMRSIEQNRTNNSVRESQIENQRQSNIQSEQARNRMMQQRQIEQNTRQQQEQQRIQQENARQQLLEQRDNQMLQQRNAERDRQRSIQTEESNRQRMQQMREAQEQRQRMQQQTNREQQINRPVREAQPIRQSQPEQQINRTQPREPIRQSQPMRTNQRAEQNAPSNNNERQTERGLRR